MTFPQFLRSRLFSFALLLVWALAYLPQLSARDLRLEEGRRAEPAAEMLRTGDYLTPHLYGEPYLNKPPLFFWLAAGLGKLQGHVSELSIRIPSTLSALAGALLLLLAFAPTQLPRHTRALAALFLLATPIMLDKGTLGEIDALLSLLTFASLTILYLGILKTQDSGLKTLSIPLRYWIASALLMSLAVLTKGPGGPIEFYGTLLPFLFLLHRSPQKKGGELPLLLSRRHLLFLLIAIIPALLWVFLMLAHTHIASSSLLDTWLKQLDVDNLPFVGKLFPHAVASSKTATPIDPDNQSYFVHYTRLVPMAIGMLLPWSLLFLPAYTPAFRRHLTKNSGFRTKNSGLYLLLSVSFPALLLIFWVWPGANPRYMMMVAYPVALLTAWLYAGPPLSHRGLPFLRFLSLLFPLLLAAGAFIAVSFCFKKCPAALPETTLVAALTLALALLALRLSLNTPLTESPIAFAATLALLISLGYGLSKSIFLPAKAPSDATAILHRQIVKIVPADAPLYTTRILSNAKGNNYFNMQFYLPSTPHALPSLTDLPPNQPAIIILAPDELPALQALAPDAQILGTLHAPNGPPPLLVVHAIRLPP